MKKEFGYIVEYRQEIGWPHGNYTEDWCEFDTKKEALNFARERATDRDCIVHAVLDYESVQRNYDPIDITSEI